MKGHEGSEATGDKGTCRDGALPLSLGRDHAPGVGGAKSLQNTNGERNFNMEVSGKKWGEGRRTDRDRGVILLSRREVISSSCRVGEGKESLGKLRREKRKGVETGKVENGRMA